MTFPTPKQVKKVFSISNPLKEFRVTQPFGANYADFYKELGLKGHNGIDFRAAMGTPCYAVADGTVRPYVDKSGGIAIDLYTAEFKVKDQMCRLKLRYYHLQRYLVESGKKVKKGQIIALADNTGRYTTGSHLHFSMKIQVLKSGKWYQDDDNGYWGSQDPAPVFDDDVDMLPVDRRYGKTFNWLHEFLMRFKTPKVHRGLIARGRHPLGLKNRELNALVYGGWDIEDILDYTKFNNWTQDTKSFYERG